jgi:hypothetical protein
MFKRIASAGCKTGSDSEVAVNNKKLISACRRFVLPQFPFAFLLFAVRVVFKVVRVVYVY